MKKGKKKRSREKKLEKSWRKDKENTEEGMRGMRESGKKIEKA